MKKITLLVLASLAFGTTSFASDLASCDAVEADVTSETMVPSELAGGCVSDLMGQGVSLATAIKECHREQNDKKKRIEHASEGQGWGACMANYMHKGYFSDSARQLCGRERGEPSRSERVDCQRRLISTGVFSDSAARICGL